MTLYTILQLVLLIVSGAAVAYLLVFAVGGLFYRDRNDPHQPYAAKIAVMIPGYKEDAVIVDVARSALEQQYPKNAYDVIVIADSFKPETLAALRELPIKVIEVQFEKRTKSKALNKAMEQLADDYAIAVILDADNIMGGNFLSKVNNAFSAGVVAVQGHRTAKNLNTSWAIMDAISEEINNHIFRKGHRALGLSSAIIGSGMAFSYPLFKTLMKDAVAVGGFDKELELMLLKKGIRIEYIHTALVYDEKVQQAEVFNNQRRRWLSAQIHYLKKGLPDAFRDLVTKGNVDYFEKVVQFVQPPRILLLGVVGLLTVLFVLLNLILDVPELYTQAWVVILIATVCSFVCSVPGRFWNSRLLGALASVPKGMLQMARSLLQTKGANRTFIHTAHGQTPNQPLNLKNHGS